MAELGLNFLGPSYTVASQIMETPGYPKCYYCSSAALQRAPDPPASSDIGDLWAALIRLLFSPAQGCWG